MKADEIWRKNRRMLENLDYCERWSIPNVVGTKIKCFLVDESIIKTEVILKDRIHQLKDISILDVVGWKLA